MKILIDIVGMFLAFAIIMVTVIIVYAKEESEKWNDIYKKRGRDDE